MHKEFVRMEQEIAKVEGDRHFCFTITLHCDRFTDIFLGLNYVIIRPADIYGPGMSSSCPMMPRIAVAAIYKYLGESMQLLWSKGLAMNVVHIKDVCRAVWLLTEKGESGNVFNLADKGSTTQGSLCEVRSYSCMTF